LIDDLSATEASALAEIIERWWDRPLAEMRLDRLWLLGAHDDPCSCPVKWATSPGRP
jgi:hypothetical protein